MSHTPSTFRGESDQPSGIDWEESAALHRLHDGGLLSELRAVRHGTLADLVRAIALMPVEEQAEYEIERISQNRLNREQILALYRRPDFPHARA